MEIQYYCKECYTIRCNIMPNKARGEATTFKTKLFLTKFIPIKGREWYFTCIEVKPRKLHHVHLCLSNKTFGKKNGKKNVNA